VAAAIARRCRRWRERRRPEVDAVDRRLPDSAHVDLFLDDASIGELGAEMGVVEGDGRTRPRILSRRDASRPAKERSLLLRQRGEKEIGEAIPLSSSLLSVSNRCEKSRYKGGVALGRGRSAHSGCHGRRYVERDADLAGRSPESVTAMSR